MSGIYISGGGNSRESPATGTCCTDTATRFRITRERNDSGKSCGRNSEGAQESV